MTEIAGPAYALLTDGTEIEIRPLRPEGAQAVRRMMSPEDIPVIAGPDGPVAVAARVGVLPTRTWDPYLRRLR